MDILNSLCIADDAFKKLLLQRCLTTKTCFSIGFINQHAYNLIHSDNEISQSFRDLDYLLRDGVGIEIALFLRSTKPGLNLNGTDFIPELISQISQSRQDVDYYCYGTKEPWLSLGVTALFKGKNCASIDGFQDDSVYLKFLTDNINPKKLSVIVLAMGIPRQEHVAKLLKEKIDAPLVILCGGGVIDFYAKRFKRASPLIRKLRLEWMIRLLNEPQRLAKRYLWGGFIFFYYVLKNKNN